MQLTIVPFNEGAFKRNLRETVLSELQNVFTDAINHFSFAEHFLLPSIAYGVLNYLYSTDNPEQYARFVVAKYYDDIRKTIAAYGGGNRLRDGKEEKNYGVIGIMNEKQQTVFYDFVNKKLYVLENDSVTIGRTDRDPGEKGGRRAMLAAPIWHNHTIAGVLTFDFFREPPAELRNRDIIRIIEKKKKNLEILMRNSCRYAEKIEQLLF
jgi:hypothetical protein